jgi:glycosyltransferase involved in cell wall biosynthesis
LGIIKNSISLRIFKYFSSYQYQQADYIGVQAQSNIKSAVNWIDEQQREKLVTLYNWLTPHKTSKPSFMFLDNLKVNYKNKKIFIYAGNVGDAQDLNLFVDAAAKLLYRKDILFIIIGRGKDFKTIFKRVDRDSIKNVIMLDEVDNNKLFEFLPLCYAGIISLHKNHKLDNIPGKLLSYLSVGIPTLGAVNLNNELVELNKRFKYGLIYDSGNVDDIVKGVIKLAEDRKFYLKTKNNSIKFFNTFFTTKEATSKILDFLN